MATERLEMRNIREVLRLHFLGGSNSRSIGVAVGCSKSAVNKYLARAQMAGITSWPVVASLDEAELERRLYPNTPVELLATRPRRELPDYAKVHEELRRRDHHVTLALLWQEYKEAQPDGYQYTQFVEYYHRWTKKLSVVMRQTHKPGEKAFVDFCDGLFITDERTGEKKRTQLFVGAMGCSSYTWAFAVESQELASWLGCHVHFYEFLGGVPAITVPDNLRSGVKKPDRYEPVINLSYRELATHYDTCVIPARIKKPRDKAKAEAAVLVAQRWILAVLRDRVFYSVAEINAAIEVLLAKLNERKMRHLGKSRRELFIELDRPMLKPLPATRYEFAEWKKVRLNIDYHITFDDHHYSAPYQLSRQILWARASGTIVEVFFKGKRVASHPRSYVKYKSTTEPSHMPPAHQKYAEWTPSRIIEWAGKTGPSTARVVEKMIESKPHPELAYRAALGIIRLADHYDKERVEKAATKALLIGSPSYTTIKSMLSRSMESAPLRAPNLNNVQQEPADRCASNASGEQLTLLAQENIRGGKYYH